MKKILILVLALCLVFACFAIFGRVGSGDVVEKNIPPDLSSTIFIGVYEPLTGANALGGAQELLGIRYANSISPSVKIDGKEYEIKLIEADNMSDIAEAEGVADQLAGSDVAAIIGSYGSGVSLAGGKVFASAGLPIIGASCTNPAVTAENPNYFRVCYLDTFQGSAMANFAYSKGYRRVAIATMVGDSYSKDLGSVFRDEFVRLGGEITEHSINSGQRNFSDLAADIKNSDADFVFLPSYPETASLFINQVRDNGLFIPVMGGDAWDSPSLLSAFETSVANIYFSAGFDAKAAAGTKAAEFSKGFASWVGDTDERLALNGDSTVATSVSALGYDAYMVLVQALAASKSPSSRDLLNSLPGLSMEGVTGQITFDEKGDSGKKIAYIKTINAATGEFELVQTSSAS